jgi:hypothetical protein
LSHESPLRDDNKDLTITTNNLDINNVPYNYKFKSRHIHFSFKNYRKNFNECEFTAKRRLQQKKADDVKNRTYQLLREHIFLRLEDNIIDYELREDQFLPRLKFDLFNVQYDKYFPEALKHLRKDVENFDDFKWIKDSIDKYNKDVKDFEDNKSNEIIKEHLEANGFFTKDKAITPNRDKEIVIPFFSQILKKKWFKNELFHLKRQNGCITVNDIIIANVTEEEQKELEICIDELFDKIKDEVNNLYCYQNNIAKNIIELSEDIKKINIKIDKGTYNTPCSECS